METYNIDSFRGGLSEEEDKGVAGSFKYGQNCDIHKRADTLSCNQKLKKESGSTVTDLILFIVAATDGNSYGFGDTGKIYKRTSGGSWSQVRDVGVKITGAEEWDGYIYYAHGMNLGRKPLPGQSNWSDAVDNWQTTLENVDWHTMRIASGALLICNGNYLAMVDIDEGFNNQAVSLQPGNLSKCLEERDDYAVIGSYRDDESEKGHIWAWTTEALNWVKKNMIPAKGVNALITTEVMVCQAGSNGELFFSDLITKIPINSFPEMQGKVNPGGVDNLNGLAMFGVYSSAKCGVYSYGRRKKNRPFALNLDYILSVGQSASIEIGAVAVVGSDLLVSWKSGSTYGVDVIDNDNKANAVYEGLEFDDNMADVVKIFKHIVITTKPLPAGCSVKAAYKTNKEGNFITAKLGNGTDTFNATGGTKAIFNTGKDGMIYEVRVELYSSGNDCPEVTAINSKYDYSKPF